MQNFNSHAHVERDFTQLLSSIIRDNFNSHAHVERDVVDTLQNREDLNFNSHAHVERDCINSNDWKRQCISTHTLTWSVTQQG